MLSPPLCDAMVTCEAAVAGGSGGASMSKGFESVGAMKGFAPNNPPPPPPPPDCCCCLLWCLLRATALLCPCCFATWSRIMKAELAEAVSTRAVSVASASAAFFFSKAMRNC